MWFLWPVSVRNGSVSENSSFPIVMKEKLCLGISCSQLTCHSYPVL